MHSRNHNNAIMAWKHEPARRCVLGEIICVSAYVWMDFDGRRVTVQPLSGIKLIVCEI